MADIFDEVAEDLRRDRAKEAWKRYGVWVIGAVVAIVLGVGLNQGWTWWQAKMQAERAQAYEAARAFLASGDQASALATLATLSDGTDGFAIVARLEAAALSIRTGDRDAGIAAYEALAADPDIAETYRGLGTLLAVMHQADQGEPAALLSQLQPVLAQTSAWRYTAREIAAGIALRQGDTAAARDFLSASAEDLGAPNAVRARAGELLRALP